MKILDFVAEVAITSGIGALEHWSVGAMPPVPQCPNAEITTALLNKF